MHVPHHSNCGGRLPLCCRCATLLLLLLLLLMLLLLQTRGRGDERGEEMALCMKQPTLSNVPPLGQALT